VTFNENFKTVANDDGISIVLIVLKWCNGCNSPANLQWG